jgi:hypothetical protein
MMTVDRSKPMTFEAIADRFYTKNLQTRIIKLWYKKVRERGAIMRYRDKIFHLWANWSPKQKKLSTMYNKTVEFLRIRKIQQCFRVFTTLCFDVISKRSVALKRLRANFCDRKIVICAYALLNKVYLLFYVLNTNYLYDYEYN